MIDLAFGGDMLRCGPEMELVDAIANAVAAEGVSVAFNLPAEINTASSSR